MKIIFHLFSLCLIVSSCSQEKKSVQTIDWGKELVGAGYIGENRDSLNSLFVYYPCEHNQPEFLAQYFNSWPSVNGDTIVLPNLLIYGLFRELNLDHDELRASSKFLIRKEGKLIKFLKLTGRNFVPKILFFKKYPNNYPKHFKYQAFDGFNRNHQFKVEINGKEGIKVCILNNSTEPYFFEQNYKSDMDELFIGSYLNLVCENRYDTTTIGGTIFCGSSLDEKLVFNDSLFEYHTYFRRWPESNILLDYFSSKIDSKTHGLDDFNSDKVCSLKFKDLKKIPVAVQNFDYLK